MKLRIIVRLAVVSGAVTAIACSDSPSVVEPFHAGLSAAPAQERLAAAFPRISAEVMAKPGTVFADYDETLGKLVFGVENASVVNAVERVLLARGFLPASYQIVITAPIQQLITLRDVWRPTRGGIQIHFSRYICTLGFNADHTASGERSFITNSHCTEDQGGVEGTEYAQPTRTIDPTVIATEVDDPEYPRGGADCPMGKRCRYSDAARALYSSGVQSDRGYIKKTTGENDGSVEVSGDFVITSQDNATTSFTIGSTLHKMGRTTGWTSGPVSRTCVNVNTGNIHLFCQTVVDATADPGDSGSPVFEITGGSNVKLVGILWGATRPHPIFTQSFVFSPLVQIQQELGSLTTTQ